MGAGAAAAVAVGALAGLGLLGAGGWYALNKNAQSHELAELYAATAAQARKSQEAAAQARKSAEGAEASRKSAEGAKEGAALSASLVEDVAEMLRS